MIVQHRLIGNIPGRGHGDPLLSPAFPLDSALARSTAYRAPDPGHIPPQAGKLSSDGKYHIHMTTFEIQTTHFGRPVLISSNVFRPANTTVRPMIYMNTVAMTEENGTPVSDLKLNTLLCFDQFITPSHFTSLNAMSKTLNADTWVPTLSPLRKPFFAPASAAHRALLTHYWAAASSRMFGGNSRVFSVCLGPQIECDAIIENAKALLLCDILPYLPTAVSNIASMSACVLESSVRALFKDSALAVVFPTAVTDALQPTFDLRRKDGYPSISELEDRFMTAVLEGRCMLMNDLLERYASMDKGYDAAKASFAADYDFALLLYQLECTVWGGEALIPADKLITAWKMLNSQLITRHHLAEAQVNLLLEDIESKLLALILNNHKALDAITDDDLPALWHKALNDNGALFSILSDIVAASPAASSFLKMLSTAPNLDFTKTARTARLISNICDTLYTKVPFSAEQITQLTSEPLLTQLRAQPEIYSALCEGLRRNIEIFSINQLETLPVSCLLLDGRQALNNAITLLHERFIDRSPSIDQINNLAAAYKNLADEHHTKQLLDYFAACLPRQLSNLQALCTTIVSLLPETDDALAVLLRSAQNSDILLNAAQTNVLFDHLHPKCRKIAQAAQAYAGYERSMSIIAGESPCDRIRRLCDCSAALSRISFDATDALCEIINGFSSENTLISKLQAEAILRSLWPLSRNKDAVRDTFGQYMVSITSNDPLRYFSNAALLDGFVLLIKHLNMDAAGILYNIFAEATHHRLHASFNELDAFFSTLLPNCVQTSAIAHQLVTYIEKTVENAQSTSLDLFPWLVSMIELAKKHRLIPLLKPYQLEHIGVRYLCSRHSKLRMPLTADAFEFVREFVTQKPDEFSTVSADVLSLYDELLKHHAGDQTETQALQMLCHFSSTAMYPALCELDKRTTSALLCNVMRESGYDNAFKAVQGAMKRCGMAEDELLARAQQEARAALECQFSAYKTTTQFEKAYRSSTSPRDLLFNDVLKEHFIKFRDAQAGRSLSLEQMDRLNTVSSQFGVGTNDLPQIIRTVSETICHPHYDVRTFEQCIQILSQNQIDPSSISKELSTLLKDNIPHLSFPQNVHAAILCNLTSNAKNARWKNVFSLLGMPVPEKMPKPFSAQGQVWLAFIHALFRALDMLETYSGYSYGKHLVDYLNSNEFADFTNNVAASNPKRLAAFYPEQSIHSPSLCSWLSR